MTLKKIKLKDFGEIKQDKRWVKKIAVPSHFLKKFRVVPNTALYSLLKQIDRELTKLYKGKKDTGKSFADSRFTAVSQALKRGMVSCGALTQIYAGVLRNYGIPVKLVHGRLKGQRGDSRHAWLRIYNPVNKKWVVVDPTNKNFTPLKTARQLKIYSTWKELREDYLRGRF